MGKTTRADREQDDISIGRGIYDNMRANAQTPFTVAHVYVL